MDSHAYIGSGVASNLNVASTSGGGVVTPALDLRRHLALVRRRLRLLLGVAVLVFLGAMVITLQLTPKYTAVASVMLDPRQEKVTDVQQVLSGLPSDGTAVDTEVEVLKSRNLAEKVVETLGLDKDPEFNGTLLPPSPLHFAFGHKDPPDPKIIHEKVVDHVLAGLKVVRSGLTLVINVSFTSKYPKKAAQIADSFADSYLLEQLDAKFDATKRASDWLNSRLGALKGQVEQAEAAVAQYKGTHGLMGLSSGEGATIAQQEISTLNTQLAASKAQEAEAEANLVTARQQIAKGGNGEDLGASLNSPVIGQLRAQRSQVSSQIADMTGRLGPRHPDMLKAQRQLADLDAQIQTEVQREISNLELQARVAHQRTASLEGSLGSSRGSLAANGSASVQLNDLQRNADSLATLYQTYLDRFKQTSNQQGLQQSDARVVSRAKVPSYPSFPNKLLNAALGFIFAIGASVATLFLIEALESGLYTSEDVEGALNLPFLGSVPLLASTLESSRGAGNISPTRFVIDKPLSSFAEALRNLRTSILSSRVGEAVKIIAITSSLPGEGKTTTSICLGRVIAMGGMKTVIVDCDLRRRTVNRLFENDPTVGLLEVLNGTCSLEAALVFDSVSGAYFLPLSKAEYTPKDVFSSPAMDHLLQTLRNEFDVVLLDTAPVLPVADTRVIAPKADVTVFLAQWRKTPRKAVENAIKMLESVGANVVGLGLTQMDMKEQARSGYGDAGYYYKAYRQYYTT